MRCIPKRVVVASRSRVIEFVFGYENSVARNPHGASSPLAAIATCGCLHFRDSCWLVVDTLVVDYGGGRRWFTRADQPPTNMSARRSPARQRSAMTRNLARPRRSGPSRAAAARRSSSASSAAAADPVTLVCAYGSTAADQARFLRPSRRSTAVRFGALCFFFATCALLVQPGQEPRLQEQSPGH